MGSGESSGDKAAYWQAVLDAQTSSGLSVRRFCAERGLALSQFYYWRRRLGAMGTERPLGEAGPETGRVPAFVELDLGKSVARGESSPLEIRLDLGGGCVLEIRRG
jgi:transposase-like protein